MADITTTALQTCIANWASALQADSASPQPTYSLDGKSVSQAEWRDKLLADIDAAQNSINARNPTITWLGGGHGRLWSGIG